jgi:cephalosporin-C deacetylase
MKSNRCLLSLFFLLHLFVCYGGKFELSVIPDHEDWIYKLGETANFVVSISGSTLDDCTVSYEMGLEKMNPIKKGSFDSDKPSFIIEGVSLDSPGFLRCSVSIITNGDTIKSYATAAFQPTDIVHTVTCPSDFLSFWNSEIAKAREIPLDTELSLIEEKSTDEFNVYHMSFLNNEYKSRTYGIVTIPVKSGKYPAIIRFPGAGVHPLGGNLDVASDKVITMDLYIHPFPMTFERSFYDNLRESQYINYMFLGASDKNSYFYKKVILGCLKAVDFIYSLEQFDGENLASWGSSQGGALSIITTSLDKRIKCLVALCPAMCDHTGYLHGRAGGWPHFFNEENIDKYNNKEVLETLPYYDVVNFAKNITVPGFYSWGFNDATTPPTSFYSAYNEIKAPKKILIIKDGEHKIYPEQKVETNKWILEFFNKN